MNRSRILALAIGASLLLGFEPAANAVPAVASPTAVGMSTFSGNVVQAFLGIERRHERRVERRIHRQERRAERRIHRQQRRAIRRGHY